MSISLVYSLWVSSKVTLTFWNMNFEIFFFLFSRFFLDFCFVARPMDRQMDRLTDRPSQWNAWAQPKSLCTLFIIGGISEGEEKRKYNKYNNNHIFHCFRSVVGTKSLEHQKFKLTITISSCLMFWLYVHVVRDHVENTTLNKKNSVTIWFRFPMRYKRLRLWGSEIFGCAHASL